MPAENLSPPYTVHTGQELELMLVGTKPLAHFYDVHPQEPCEDIIPVEAFAPYVTQGRFSERSYVELLQDPPPKGHEHVRGILHVFYALQSEEWRIDEYIQLQAESAKSGWSEAFERRQGALLGYEPWQCDAHMEALRASPVSCNWYWLRTK
jgi:hypothetical protein